MENNTARPLAVGPDGPGRAGAPVAAPANFAPVGSISLFAGARLRGWQAYVLPLVLMAVTDPLVGGYSVATPLVYASFLINVWIGSRLRGTENPLEDRRRRAGRQPAVLPADQFRLAGAPAACIRTRWPV